MSSWRKCIGPYKRELKRRSTFSAFTYLKKLQIYEEPRPIFVKKRQDLAIYNKAIEYCKQYYKYYKQFLKAKVTEAPKGRSGPKPRDSIAKIKKEAMNTGDI